MVAQITPFPGHGPATRVLSGNTATEEQRRVSAAYLGEIYPQDILWMESGTHNLYRCTPIKSRAVEWFSAASTAAVLLAAGWVAGLLTILAVMQ
jgi:hypothetical protein